MTILYIYFVGTVRLFLTLLDKPLPISGPIEKITVEVVKLPKFYFVQLHLSFFKHSARSVSIK